ncbi:methyl-accepting chemotaxis protein [Salidesulfovibrio onnuriiensis]|uniref:methyl-accepting chemotaxis protein n=1 Tax=Salidesulfovibrio onnuriiensis TaxID=2583823 RepID=UPI00202B8343|nr:methyl-accepting chemotaxis protein [Salidesulfovibrio onnuriiensis]
MKVSDIRIGLKILGGFAVIILLFAVTGLLVFNCNRVMVGAGSVLDSARTMKQAVQGDLQSVTKMLRAESEADITALWDRHELQAAAFSEGAQTIEDDAGSEIRGLADEAGQFFEKEFKPRMERIHAFAGDMPQVVAARKQSMSRLASAREEFERGALALDEKIRGQITERLDAGASPYSILGKEMVWQDTIMEARVAMAEVRAGLEAAARSVTTQDLDRALAEYEQAEKHFLDAVNALLDGGEVAGLTVLKLRQKKVPELRALAQVLRDVHSQKLAPASKAMVAAQRGYVEALVGISGLEKEADEIGGRMVGQLDQVLALSEQSFGRAVVMADTAVIVGLGISLALAVGVALFLNRVITNPLRETMEAAEAVAGGDLDVRLSPEGSDETSLMQRSLNAMITTLKTNITEMETKEAEANRQAEAAHDALQKAEEAMAQARVATKEGMLTAAGRLEGVVGHINEATGDIARVGEEIRSGTDVQLERINEAATAMEQMNATVLEVARNAAEAAEQADHSRSKALEGAGLVSDTVQAMADMQQLTMELRENMHKLGTQSEAIGQVMNVINDIADQTNLLALNAAIEAARAGDAGRGFAVVADEVRKLAEKTMGATKEVGDNIQGIQHLAKLNVQGMDRAVDAINGATEISNQSGTMLQEIVRMAQEAAAQVQSIAAAAEEQSAASEQITRSVDEINGIARDNTDRVGRSGRDIQGLSEQARVLSQLVEDLKAEGS